MEKIQIIKAENAGNLTVFLTFNDNTTQKVDIGDYIRRHPHPQYNKYKKKSEFKKFWLRNGNLIWGKHADLSFPLNALYFGNLDLCCDDEWPEVN